MQFLNYPSPVDDGVLTRCAAVYVEVFTAAPRFENWTTETAFAHLKRLSDAGGEYFVGQVEDSQVICFAIGMPLAAYHNREELISQGAPADGYYFVESCTLAAHRGQGLASTLNDMRESAAIASGFSLAVSRVRADNRAQLSLLGKRGFKEIGRYEGTIAGSVSERIILAKDLNADRR